jgi:hypothetical protein
MEKFMSNSNNENENCPSALLSNPDAQREDLVASEHAGLVFDENTTHALVSVCVSATASNGKICVKFPVVGNICFSPPVKIPNGAVKVCMSTCGFKITPPFFKGIKATVQVNGVNVWSGTIWGSC